MIMGKLKTIILLMIITILCSLSFFTLKKEILKKNVKKNIENMSNFEMNTIDGSLFNTTFIHSQPIVLIFFHPECEICQVEIKQIVQKKKDLAQVCILLVTQASIKESQDFYEAMELNKISNIYLLHDSDLILHNRNLINTIPSIYLYNSKKKLIKQYKGEINIDLVIKAIKN